MIVYAEDHLFIRVSEPDHGLLHVNAGIAKQRAVCVAEVMSTNLDGMTGSEGQRMQPGIPGPGESCVGHHLSGNGRADQTDAILQERPQP